MKTYKLLSIDESGKPSYEHRSPFFILSGVVIPEGIKASIDQQARTIKKKYFNNEEIVFHFREMKNKKGKFARLRDRTIAKSFWDEFKDVMQNPDISLFFVISDKQVIREESGWLPQKIAKTILEKSYHKLLSDFVYQLKITDSCGKILLESDPAQDTYFLNAHNRLQNKGIATRSISGDEYRKMITSISFVNKHNLDIEVQIADMLAPIARIKYEIDILNLTKKINDAEKMMLELINAKFANSANPSFFEPLL